MIKSCYPYLERVGHKVQDIIQSMVISFECAHLGGYRHVCTLLYYIICLYVVPLNSFNNMQSHLTHFSTNSTYFQKFKFNLFAPLVCTWPKVQVNKLTETANTDGFFCFCCLSIFLMISTTIAVGLICISLSLLLLFVIPWICTTCLSNMYILTF